MFGGVLFLGAGGFQGLIAGKNDLDYEKIVTIPSDLKKIVIQAA